MFKALLTLNFVFFLSLPLLAQVDTVWVRTYGTSSTGRDIATDYSGNVYVTGESWHSGTNLDYMTIKYCSNGDTSWVRSYNGTADSPDRAYAVAIDASGNVYVTGEAVNSFSNADYVTIKYSPVGDVGWVRSYDGPGNYKDSASCLAVDGYGNVYVSGGSYDSVHYEDYATIKYLSNGDIGWVARYNGTGDSTDRANALCLDNSGNVYVTGASCGKGSGENYTTIKYNPNGDTAWVRRYNGSGNFTDMAFDIGVDNYGSVYVTGWSFDSLAAFDYTTIKYDSSGNEIWIKRFNGEKTASSDKAYALTVDDAGNVYVTGAMDGYFYATVKYYSYGDTAWVRIYRGDRFWSVAQDIAVDSLGNAYVTGYSMGSSLHWPFDVTCDYATIKYGADGQVQWARRYDSPLSGDDFALAVVLDDSGNVYVTGLSYGRCTTIRYFQARRSDLNGDGLLTISDVIYLINYLFKGGAAPVPIQSGDCNCDVRVTVSDVVYFINYLFKGGPAPSC